MSQKEEEEKKKISGLVLFSQKLRMGDTAGYS
jgi:hypothetical protein